MTVRVRVRLMICEPAGGRFAEPEIFLHLVRDLESIREPESEAMLYRCENSGAGVSLLFGVAFYM